MQNLKGEPAQKSSIVNGNVRPYEAKDTPKRKASQQLHCQVFTFRLTDLKMKLLVT